MTVIESDKRMGCGSRRRPPVADGMVGSENLRAGNAMAVRRGQLFLDLSSEGCAGRGAALLGPNIRERFSTVISDVATTGNSGSGVFARFYWP